MDAEDESKEERGLDLREATARVVTGLLIRFNVVYCMRCDGFNGLIPIEHSRRLFESAVLRFNNENIAIDKLKGDPANIDDVVLPCDIVEGDRVDVLVEDEGHRDREVEDVEPLCADGEGQNLDGVRDDEWGERNTADDSLANC